MLGNYPQHLTLLQFLNRDHPDQEELVTQYRQWIRGGNEFAWTGEAEAWEEQGQQILAQIREVMGPVAIQNILKEEENHAEPI